MAYENHPMNCPNCTRKWGLVLAFGLMLSSFAVEGQQSTWNSYNYGSVFTTAPQIDATNFYNSGLWEIGTFFPYQTSYTLNYTNAANSTPYNGTMIGTVGWEFDYGTPTIAHYFQGGTYLSANFVNSGLIEAEGSSVPDPILDSPLDFLLVAATNIINKPGGTLQADWYGEIILVGTNVNLSRSTLLAGNPGSSTLTTSYNEAWAQAAFTNLVTSQVWNGSTASSGGTGLPATFNVMTPCGSNTATINISPTLADSISLTNGLLLTVTNAIGTNYPVPANNIFITNIFVPTNVIHQAVFVYVSDPNIFPSDGFSTFLLADGLPNTSNLFANVSVQLTSVYGGTWSLQDTLATSNPRGFSTNSVPFGAACSGPPEMPDNYTFAFGGTNGIGPPPANFLYDPSWEILVTNATYAYYSDLLDDEASEPPSSPGPPNSTIASSVTNLTGRVRIYADTLNLLDTQIKAYGEIVIQANHLVSSQNASNNCPNLSFNLGSTNGGYLNVTNLAITSVPRFNGTVSAWSALWTNYLAVISTNYGLFVTNFPDPNNPTNTITQTNYVHQNLTNTLEIGLYALMVDASALQSVAPVTVYDLILHSTNIVISDSMNVIETFLMDGRSLTLNGDLTFPGGSPVNPVAQSPFCANPILYWVYTMAPTLLYFTNNGSLFVPYDAHFGDDGPTNYLAFINNGSITTYLNQTINSANLQINNGFNYAYYGNFSATAGTAVLSNATINTGGDIDIVAGTLLIDPSTLVADNMLNFTVTNSLSDAGVDSGNSLSCQGGFNLWIKPQTGDLWGTTITTTASGNYAEVDSAWAGRDRGPSGAGFTNNTALYDLILSPQNFSAPDFPLFYFSGTGVSNGLYVGTLDLTQLGTNINAMLAIDPSLNIYYAHALLAFTPPHSLTPEEYLDGQQFSGGYLYHVKNFTALPAADPSFVTVPSPTLSASYVKSNGQFQLTMAGTPGQNYTVQVSTNLVNWVPIYTNSAPVNGLFQFLDSQTANYPARFYRVVSGP